MVARTVPKIQTGTLRNGGIPRYGQPLEGMEGREITEVIQSALNRADLTNLTVDFIGSAFRLDFWSKVNDLGSNFDRQSGRSEVVKVELLLGCRKK